MTTQPIILLAPAPGLAFAATPSGTAYVSDANALIVLANESVADQLALIEAGCLALSPNAGGAASIQPGTTYTAAAGDIGNALVFTAAQTVTVNLPAFLPVGFAVTLYQGGAGRVNAIAQAPASLVTPNMASTQAQYCALLCIVIANPGGTAAQWNVIQTPAQTGSGVVGAATLASLYAQDGTAHYPSSTVAQIFSDPVPANDGYWLKTGTATGAGNWTQQSAVTLSGLNAAIAAETGRAVAAESALQNLVNDVIFPDENVYAGGIFDGSGNPLFGILPGGATAGLVALPSLVPGTDAVWPDDAGAIEGDIGFADADATLLLAVPNAAIAAIANSVAASAVSSALANYTSDDAVWPDDQAGGGVIGDLGFADSNGAFLLPVSPGYVAAQAAIAANVAIAAALGDTPSSDCVWPDDVSNIPGNIALADMNSNLLDYQWAGTYSSFVAGLDSSGCVCALHPASTLQVPIASARGALAATPTPVIRGLGQPDRFDILRWWDDGTADGLSGNGLSPQQEARAFFFDGAAAVAAISGITKIVLIPMTGQSLSNGSTAGVLTTANVFSRAFMFNGGPHPFQPYYSSYATADYGWPGALCRDSQLQSLTPLYEIAKPPAAPTTVSPCGETYGGGISWWMGQGTNLESTSAMVFATLGAGGSSLAYLLQGGTTNAPTSPIGGASFANIVRAAERVAAWCKLNGWTLEIPCVVMDQGENDYSTSGSTYLSELQEFQTQLNTALGNILTKIGQTPPSQIPLMMIQPSSWAFYSQTTAPNVYEMIAAAIASPTKFVVIGPQYWNQYYNSASGQHMLAEGYRQCGEYTGRAIQRLRASLASEAVYVTAVSNSGTTITITFNTQSQLVHDTSLVTDPNSQWGIRLLNGSNANVALSSFSIVGTNQIQCTAASSISGQSCMLGIADYAYGTLGLTSGPTTSARAPIRDSASDVSSAATGSINMYNFACHQQFSFTGV